MNERLDLYENPLTDDNHPKMHLDSKNEFPLSPHKNITHYQNKNNLRNSIGFIPKGQNSSNEFRLPVEKEESNISVALVMDEEQRKDIAFLKGKKDSLKIQIKESELQSFKTENQTNEKKIEEKIRTQEELMLREFDLLDEVGPFDDTNGKNNSDDDYDDDDEDDDDDDEDDDDDDEDDEDDDDGFEVDDDDEDENDDNDVDEDEDEDDDEDEDEVYYDEEEADVTYDLSEDEVDAMLEERLNNLQPPKKKVKVEIADTENTEGSIKTNEEEKEYTEKEKIVLVEKVKNHFEVLPDGWVTLTHNSGMPLYLHRPSRVCTLSKPYCLGPGSARKHAIPLSAVPCLEYRRAKEEEKKKNNETDKPTVLVINGTEIPNARVETAQENEMSRQLTPEQLTEYCKSLFEFNTIQVFRFKSWSARRKFKKQKNEKTQQRPTLPKDTKLITCPIRQSNSCGKSGQIREWIMNPSGKSYVCILHEYVQRALKDQPVYNFKELENTATPYLAVVSIGNIQYGTGFGSSKKQAKHDAAKSTLEILIPEMKEKIDQDEKLRGHAGHSRGNADLSFFDGIKIEDPRVTEFCAKTTEPLPYEILLRCLQRNFGLSQMNIKYETTPLKHCKNEFIMSVGNHTAKVICRNKRDGKQKASQVILQALHPHIPSWGSLLRLYGNTSVKTVKEKKIEEREITLLQSRGNSHSPNYAILNKLREEMKKFKAMKSAIKPIGKFIPPDDVELPAESGTDLSNVLI